MKKILILGLLLVTAGCGGRVAHPVAATNDFDDRLSCDHLQAERAVNNSEFAELVKERKNDEVNNVGMVLLSPIMMDLSSSERKEAEALVKRDEVLDKLIAAKCPK